MKCGNCGSEFEPNKSRPNQKYCSVKCRKEAYYKRTRERQLLQRRKKHELNREAERLYRRAYYLAHREKQLLNAKRRRVFGGKK